MKLINQIHVLFAGETVGDLIWQDRQYWFQYDPMWLRNGFDLSPQTLSFNSDPQLAPNNLFQGLPGVFHDSLPDGWGLLLMDRFFKKVMKRDLHEITLLERLAYMGHRAMGALEYEPVISEDSIKDSIDLSILAIEAEKILNGRTQAVLNQLRIQGGSPGGARPKVTVALSDQSDECLSGFSTLPAGFSHWLVKFRSESDPKDMGRIEKSYAELAQKAGLKVPPSRLLSLQLGQRKEDYFAVKRFDRTENKKHHLLSMSGYVYADHRLPSLDYHSILAATMVLTKNIQEVISAFRLMIFNIATHNKDDHAKNFTFIHERTGEWKLAPAYDLTFSAGMNNQHTTAINGSGNPTHADIAAIAEAHNIKHWESILEEVLDLVASWPIIARANQVNKSSIDSIEKTFKAIRQRLQH
jgi:serine/threonine-protein kinase HipA